MALGVRLIKKFENEKRSSTIYRGERAIEIDYNNTIDDIFKKVEFAIEQHHSFKIKIHSAIVYFRTLRL